MLGMDEFEVISDEDVIKINSCEQEELEPGLGCGEINDACDELIISNEDKDHNESPIVVYAEHPEEYE